MTWREGIAASDDALDAHFGELFELIPRIAGANTKGADDPNRRGFCFVGIFYDDDSTIDGAPTHNRRSTQPSVSVLNRNIENPIKHRDWLKQQCTGAIWEVTHQAEDGITKTEFHLVKSGRGPRT
ncbi:MAG: hypothetical protein COB93_00155 [Sneathiella sp.]|nr:MAG: hypothetical protein COB93_00155 [Sneathiella sp.]